MTFADAENYARAAVAQATGLAPGASDSDLALAAAKKFVPGASLELAAGNYIHNIPGKVDSAIHAKIHKEAVAAGHAAARAGIDDLNKKLDGLEKESGGLVLVGVGAVGLLLLAMSLE